MRFIFLPPAETKNRSAENELAYKRQRNYCTNLLRRRKATPSQICNNKKFWNTVKPLLSDKCMVTDSITLTENKDNTPILPQNQILGHLERLLL